MKVKNGNSCHCFFQSQFNQQKQILVCKNGYYEILQKQLNGLNFNQFKSLILEQELFLVNQQKMGSLLQFG
ncbi:unnamed protein product [Paramecium octaurelia]|uniref:Uncharacterized protein n=1 Tax=Paramecium octaurelia TaxID=43137 RepID=A0A8S1YMY5_PAROT|nr:unnamed protein product [Paramecium octaurelia]